MSELNNFEELESNTKAVELTDNKVDKPKKKVKERETWSGRFDFFLAALGYAGKQILILK